MTANVQNTGTQILFADHATDFGAAPATAANSLIIGSPTDVQIDLSSLAAAGGGRQSAKVDLGTPRPILYKVDACIEHATAPADAETVDFYWGPSPNTTAATGNVGATTGSDAAYTDSPGNLAQMQFIGSLVLTTGTTNIGHVGFLLPAHRYGNLVVINSSAADLLPATVDECHITFTPVVYGDA